MQRLVFPHLHRANWLRSSARSLAALVAVAAAFGTSAAHAQAVANPYTQTRTVAFEYSANGLLTKETVEPDSPSLCVATTYGYDGQGNRNSSSTGNCANAPDAAKFSARGSKSTFNAAISVKLPAGRVAITPSPHASTVDPATDANAHTESREYDPRFGVVTRLVGPNGEALATKWELDDFGRVVKETRADTTQTITRYCYIPGKILGYDVAANNVNSNGCPTAAPAEAPNAAVMFQHTEAQDSAGNKISAWSREYFDAAGRKMRVATESFDGPNQPAAPGSVVVQDTDYNVHGAPVRSTKPFFLATNSTLTTGGNNVGLTQTEYDFLGRPKAVYVSDPANPGNPEVDFGAGGRRPAAVTTMAYNGLESTVTDAAGNTRTELKNADGKVVRITDARGATLVHHHDAFGNLILTEDALGNKISVQYDLRGRKVRLEDPDAGVTAYCYDALGQLKAQQTSNMRGGHGASSCPTAASDGTAAVAVGGWSTLAYDRMGRLTQRIDPEYTSTWYHDRDDAGNTCGPSVGKTCQSHTSHGVSRRTFYDSLGRVVRTRTDVLNGPSTATGITYDSVTGRPDVQTYPSGLQVKSLYTNKGALLELKSLTTLTVAGANANPVLWRAHTVDAAGRAERQVLGNGVESRASYDADSGRLLRITAGTGGQNNVVDQELRWNNLNRLTFKSDAIGPGNPQFAVTDTYTYDELGRLTQYVVAGNGNPNVRTVVLQYNAAGMLLYKSDVGIYTYANKGVALGQPHALRSVGGGLHNASYGYDLNGNLTSASGGKYRSVGYTSFNLPNDSQGLQGPGGTPKYTWQYDENRQRIRETRVNAQGTRTTWYMHPDNAGGLGFEHEVPSSGAAQNRHFIGGVAVVVTEGALPAINATTGLPAALSSVTVAKLEYWHKDHLGSLIATTNQTAVVTARYSYDPFGKRRVVNGSYDPFGNIVVDWGAAATAGADRGYTGHEHLDDVGVIHMNGRIFDPLLGRFMQADPFIQAPDTLQNYDRYAYCYNNPTTCTDPSGYLSFRLPHQNKNLREFGRAIDDFRRRPNIHTHHQMLRSLPGQGHVDRFMMNNEFAYTVAKIVVAYFTLGFGAAGMDAYYTYERTGSANAAFKVAAVGAVTSAAFVGVGWAGSQYGWSDATMVFAHAAVGCASAELGGGNCGQGALAAGFGKAMTIASRGFVQGFEPGFGRLAVGTTIAAFTGGIAAELGGGKFANGAQTAAMGYLFNQTMSDARERAARAAPGDRRGFWARLLGEIRGDPLAQQELRDSAQDAAKEALVTVVKAGSKLNDGIAIVSGKHPAGMATHGTIGYAFDVLEFAITDDLNGVLGSGAGTLFARSPWRVFAPVGWDKASIFLDLTVENAELVRPPTPPARTCTPPRICP
jgi:RHS repeat-associated protein